MSQLPRYESYKDSGVQWLGEIPSHWAVVRLDQGCEIVRGNTGFSKADLLEEGQYVALQYGRTYKVDEINNTFSSYVNEEFYKLSQIAMYGDTVLISTSETIEDLGHSCFYARQDIGLIGGEQFLLKVNQEEKLGKYLYYLSKAFSSYLRKYATGTKVYRFNTDHLKKIYIPQIPFNEQKIIADFLDKRLAQVDALIAKQETLLEKLAEQRVALISHAVTKGLDPDVEMKESGIEILGNIPQQWKIKRLKFLLSEKLKYGANESAESEDKENPRYIRITDIDDSGNLKDETFKSLEFEKAEEYLLNDADILLARSGATVGKSDLYKAESVGIACYAGYLIRARLDQVNYNPEFVNYFLQSKQYWDWISSINIQATIQNVSAEKYNDLTLAIPPLEEQKQLIEYLKNEDEKFNRAIGKGKKLVHLLNEYRSTLITQVVTGKIDVRNLKVN